MELGRIDLSKLHIKIISTILGLGFLFLGLWLIRHQFLYVDLDLYEIIIYLVYLLIFEIIIHELFHYITGKKILKRECELNYKFSFHNFIGRKLGIPITNFPQRPSHPICRIVGVSTATEKFYFSIAPLILFTVIWGSLSIFVSKAFLYPLVFSLAPCIGDLFYLVFIFYYKLRYFRETLFFVDLGSTLICKK